MPHIATLEETQALRRIQIAMQYHLNTHCNEKQETLEQLAERTRVPLKSIKRMAQGTFDGSYPSFVTVSLAIGQVPHLEFVLPDEKPAT